MSIILYCFVLLFLILFPSDTAAYATQAMQIWARNLIPFLFPYMVFSRLLFQRFHTLNFPTVPFTAFLGILGGSPSGSMLIAASASQLSQRNLYTLSMLCSSVSPMFILGTLQALTENSNFCRLLLVSHWFSCAFCACAVWILFRNTQEENPHSISKKNHLSLANPIPQSIDAIMQVGGCIICCSVLAGILTKILQANMIAPVLHSVLEISGGAHAIWQSSFSLKEKAVLLSAALGFNGVSILVQNHTFLKPLGISIRVFLLFAVFRALCSAAYMALLLPFI